MLNPHTAQVSKSVAKLYPNFSKFVDGGGRKPSGETWGVWKYEVITRYSSRFIVIGGSFSDSIRSICHYGDENDAVKIEFNSIISTM